MSFSPWFVNASHLPVIVISGEFSGVDVPNSILADAFFEKSQYTPDQIIARIAEMVGRAQSTSVWTTHTPAWIPHGESEQVGVTCYELLANLILRQSGYEARAFYDAQSALEEIELAALTW